METMIVEISIPAISKTYDFQLPAGGIVHDVIAEIIRILVETQSSISFDKHYPMLCHLNDGRILNPNDTLAAAGVYDGVSLMLI
jgi:uncharacterized ubiquitin-like protein YukD